MWTDYLQQVGAQFKDNIILNFGQLDKEQQQALHGDIITSLSHFGLIKVTGSEAENFLQGQLTSDVRQVTTEHCQLSAWCTPKGRILANFRLFKRDEAYYLLLPRESVSTVSKRLQMYILRADVKLEPCNDDFLPCIAIAGRDSTQILIGCLGYSPPNDINTSLTAEGTTLLHIHGTQPRYLIFSEAPQNLWQCASQKAQPVGAEIWQLLDILAGIPQIVPTTAEDFVPQMINYQAIEGVSFKKGCYTGQEIVARMQYLGSLKRRMYLAKISTAIVPQPGDKLYISGNEQSVGKIVNAATHPEGGFVVLAVIQINHINAGEKIHWPNQQGEILQFMELPYSLEK